MKKADLLLPSASVLLSITPTIQTFSVAKFTPRLNLRVWGLHSSTSTTMPGPPSIPSGVPSTLVRVRLMVFMKMVL